MENILLEPSENGQQAFVIRDGDEKLAEMVIKVSGNTMSVLHTEVAPEAEGKGLAKVLLKEMVDHSRQQQLKVIPLCTFVLAQFKRHPELYGDIWERSGS
ncbi:MAG: GNAT family N-acetyltransferase [Ferruginibacter sp.]